VYEPWIDLRATLCVLDPRQLLDEKASTTTTSAISWPRRTSLANKSDRETPKAPRRCRLVAALGRRSPQVSATQGNIDPPCLMSRAATPPRCRRARNTPTAIGQTAVSPRSACRNTSAGAAPQQRPGLSGLRLDFRRRNGFDTIGLLEWARLAPVARVKGVMRIAEGAVRINRQGEDLHIETLNVAPPDSRIELIPRMKPTGTHSRPPC
jgi:G3E family GTPase